MIHFYTLITCLAIACVPCHSMPPRLHKKDFDAHSHTAKSFYPRAGTPYPNARRTKSPNTSHEASSPEGESVFRMKKKTPTNIHTSTPQPTAPFGGMPSFSPYPWGWHPMAPTLHNPSLPPVFPFAPFPDRAPLEPSMPPVPALALRNPSASDASAMMEVFHYKCVNDKCVECLQGIIPNSIKKCEVSVPITNELQFFRLLTMLSEHTGLRLLTLGAFPKGSWGSLVSYLGSEAAAQLEVLTIQGVKMDDMQQNAFEKIVLHHPKIYQINLFGSEIPTALLLGWKDRLLPKIFEFR